MATQYVMTPAVPNRSLSAKLYSDAMVEQASASSITESITNSGIYEVVFTEASALSGSFRLVITDILTGYGVASYEAYFVGTDGERINASEYHAIGSADEKLNDILAKITPITTVYTAQPSSETINLIRGDAYSGVIDRTFVIAAVDGTNTIAYAFNGRVSQFQIDAQVGAEAKCVFTIHPRGNQYGWSNNT